MGASATDSDGTISRVEFYQGSNLLATDTTAPYVFDWTNVGPGSYSIVSRAYDNLDAVGTSSALSILVNNPNIAPTTNLTSPFDGATFTAPATVTLTANAIDVDGTVVRVEFYQGATLLGTDISAPYSFDSTNVPAGNYHARRKNRRLQDLLPGLLGGRNQRADALEPAGASARSAHPGRLVVEAD